MSGTLMTDVSVSSRPMTESPLTERQWVRRGELLEAARRVFERDGYHAATVSSIVQMAGLSQGAFYLYFGDKKAVFAALQEEMATLLRRRIYWATRNQSDPASRLRIDPKPIKRTRRTQCLKPKRFFPKSKTGSSPSRKRPPG